MALNPYDSETRLGYGLCLDWLDRPKEATRYFVQAMELRRNNARVQWKFAWHCMILRNYPLAKIWLERSLDVLPSPEAQGYLEVVKCKDGRGPPRQPGGAIKAKVSVTEGERQGRSRSSGLAAARPVYASCHPKRTRSINEDGHRCKPGGGERRPGE